MADLKISQLSAVTDVLDTDEFVLARSGATKKIDGVDLREQVGNLRLLHDETLAATGTFDVSSISQSYADLLLKMMLRATTSALEQVCSIRFNNDTGNNYDHQEWAFSGGGSGAARTAGTDRMKFVFVPAANSGSGRVTYVRMEILEYAGTTFHKGHFSEASSMHNDQQSYYGASGRWASTSAINRIQVFPDSGSFAIGSRLRIYGIQA